MISYSEYKLLKEDAPPGAPPAVPGPAGAGAPPAGAPPAGGSDPMPPPGFGSGGGLPASMGAPDMGGLGGGPSAGASNLKPSGLKSSNVWSELEEYVEKLLKKIKDQK